MIFVIISLLENIGLVSYANFPYLVTIYYLTANIIFNFFLIIGHTGSSMKAFSRQESFSCCKAQALEYKGAIVVVPRLSSCGAQA